MDLQPALKPRQQHANLSRGYSQACTDCLGTALAPLDEAHNTCQIRLTG